MSKLDDNARCDECMLWRPHYPGGRSYCHLNRKEYKGEVDGIACALIEQTHVTQDRHAISSPCILAVPGSDEANEVIDTLRRELAHIGRRCIGLASNQMHYNTQIAVIHHPNAAICTRELVLINPEIITVGKDTISWTWEGCMSIENGLKSYPVPRARSLTLKWLDENGAEHVEQFTYGRHGDLVFAIQHEIDHLHGIPVTSYIDKTHRTWSDDIAKVREEYIAIANQSAEARQIARTTPVRAEKKIGRNSPCPCGSGKKYKYCCLRK